jgi:F-type H+-transporting ATPase subunit delta
MSSTELPQRPSDPVEGYARALFTVADAEGVLDRVEDEVFRFARAAEGSPQLRDRLTDPSVETPAKLDVIDQLLSGRAHPQTISALLFVVQAGRARQVAEIADALVGLAAESRSRTLAEVRTAVELTDEQRSNLVEALESTTGQQIELKVVVDPEVLGGLVINVGDTLIDASVARRLQEVRAQMTQGA